MRYLFLFVKIRNRLQSSINPAYYTLLAKIKLALHGVCYGKGLSVDGKLLLSPTYGRITIGVNCKLVSRKAANLVGLTGLTSFQVIKDGQILIGDNCGFSAPVFSSRACITIGNNVLMGGNVRIYDHDYHALDYRYRRRGVPEHEHIKKAPVVIEDDVFIGTNAIILKGVRVGARTVIGAGSVVSLKNIPPDSMVAGNPAKIIKQKQD